MIIINALTVIQWLQTKGIRLALIAGREWLKLMLGYSVMLVSDSLKWIVMNKDQIKIYRVTVGFCSAVCIYRAIAEHDYVYYIVALVLII